MVQFCPTIVEHFEIFLSPFKLAENLLYFLFFFSNISFSNIYNFYSACTRVEFLLTKARFSLHTLNHWAYIFSYMSWHASSSISKSSPLSKSDIALPCSSSIATDFAEESIAIDSAFSYTSSLSIKPRELANVTWLTLFSSSSWLLLNHHHSKY